MYSEVVRTTQAASRPFIFVALTATPERERAIQGLRNELADTDCQLVLAADSVLIAEHAHAEGYISARGLQAPSNAMWPQATQEVADERSAN